MLIAFLVACAGIYFLRRWAKQRQEQTGKSFLLFRISLFLIIILPLLAWATGGAPTTMNTPVLRGFNFIGGLNISPEFTALLLGFVLYTATFVAEIVRAGIQSVSRGQTEAAMSLGLKPGQILNLVILPQALKIVIPPTVSILISAFMDTSLVVIIALYDILKTTQSTLSNPKWMGFSTEAYLFVALIYFICCYFMSTWSRRLEVELNTDR